MINPPAAVTVSASKPVTKKKQILKKNNRKKPNSGQLKNTTGKIENNSTRNRSTRLSGKDAKKVESNSHDEVVDKKMKGQETSDDPTIGHIKRDEEDHHAVSVIVSLDDSITLKQVRL